MRFKTTPRQAEPDTTDWLDDLPPAAVEQGRKMLELCIVPDRASLREYLWAFDAWAALPRTQETRIEALGEAFSRASTLLAATK